MTPKEKYQLFCKAAKVPLFFQPEWLDLCRLPWYVLMSEVDEQKAFLIYHIEKKAGFTFIRNPHLTPYTGLIFCNDNIDSITQQELVNKLIFQLPKFDVLDIHLSLSIPLSLTFSNIGCSFDRTNLIALNHEKDIYQNFKPSLKRQIKKAEKLLQITESDDIDLFYQIHQKTFQKQDREPWIPLKIFKDYWTYCLIKGCGKILFSKDNQNNVHAAMIMVYDEETTYYLAGGSDDKFYGSGAMSALMWYAIQKSLNTGQKIFDFEGSMIPSINQFFRNFSPVEKSYLHLKKVNSIIYKLLKSE